MRSLAGVATRWGLVAVMTVAGAVAPLLAAATTPAPTTATVATETVERISAFQAAVLGVVEGLTEYLPVSSTGHLILAGEAMGLGAADGLAEPPAVDAFEIVIQLGAILAVVGLYRRRVGQMLAGLLGRNAAGLRLAGLLAVAFVPAAVVGLALHRPIKEHLFGPAAVAGALAVGGLLMIGAERFLPRGGRRKIDDLAFRHALIIGLAQCLSLWPGTSRSMVTILAGLAVGLDHVAAAEFSFLLALPTLGAATVYEGLTSRAQLMHAAGPDGLLIGLLVSAVVAAVAIRGLVHWLTRHGLTPFGVYRLVVAAVVYAVFLVKG